MREKLTTKESQGEEGGDITVLCLHGDGGSMTGTICQNL